MATENKNTTTKKPTNKGNNNEVITESEIEKVFNSELGQAKINEIVAKALASMQSNVAPQVVQVNASEEMVTLLSMEVAQQGTMVFLGENIGEIASNGGMLDVPKKTFLQRCSIPVIANRLKDGRLLVIDGLDDNELKRIGALHKKEELLDNTVFQDLLNWDIETACKTFERACPQHKQIMATLYTDAYVNHDNRVNQALVQRLNELSKSADEEGMFTAILKDMAKQLADG